MNMIQIGLFFYFFVFIIKVFVLLMQYTKKSNFLLKLLFTKIRGKNERFY